MNCIVKTLLDINISIWFTFYALAVASPARAPEEQQVRAKEEQVSQSSSRHAVRVA